jgi:hypothetical protein
MIKMTGDGHGNYAGIKHLIILSWDRLYHLWIDGSDGWIGQKLIIICSIGTIFYWWTCFYSSEWTAGCRYVKFTMVSSVVLMWSCFVSVWAIFLGLTFHLGVFGVWYALLIDGYNQNDSYTFGDCFRAVVFSPCF